MNLSELIQAINAELDASVRGEPPYPEAHRMPVALREFYSECNGISLPFVEIYPADRIKPEFIPGWLCFGFDGYFSYCLCRDSAIDLWDHESGLEPEASYSNVLELLLDVYSDRVERSDREGRVVVTAFPHNVRASELVSTLKVVDARSSSQLLTALRALPIEIPCRRRDGLRVVRALHAKGVSCKLRIAA